MSEPPVLDPTTLHNLRALSPNDGGAFVREIIEIFLQEAPPRLGELEAAFAAGDAGGVTRIAHSIKGSCGNFGATRLAAVSLEMEQAAKTGQLEPARALLPEFHAAFGVTRTALEQLLSELK